jgi:DNA-directed RNA polymerase subunit M/transcription elongation factor TFIIS
MEELREKSLTFLKENFNNPEEVEESIYNYAIERLDDLGYQDSDELPLPELQFLYSQNLTKVLENNDNDVYKSREDLLKSRWETLYKNRTEDIVKKKGAHKCPKCKSWFTNYVEVQTRSADESATIKVSCECGYRWKMN